ncbi:MAG: response regulator [Lachnospiraceae bacterium]|nr:response regulator [Lachnospiraceae bacterium]
MKYNILIIDDEVYTLEDICSCIDTEALPVGELFTAVNTTRARKILDEQDIHVILSDIDMPGGDGISFMRSVRDTHADTPCIFITNYAEFSYAQEAIHLNVLDYLLKPVEPEILNRALEKAFAIARENLGQSSLQAPAPDMSLAASGKKDSYVSNALAFLEDNLQNDITRESVSDHVHLTPDHLDRLFREQMGMSVFRCIVFKKIELAKKLLMETNQPIGCIAADLGYCNLSNFSSAFRKLCGMTPAEYRKMMTG